MKLLWRLSTFAIVLGFLFSLIAFVPFVSADDGQNSNPLPERLLVRFQPGTSLNDMVQVHKREGASVEATLSQIGVQVVTIPQGQRASKMASYRTRKEVRYVEVDSVAQAVDVPNDPSFNVQWDMTKVQAPQAWGVTKGSQNVIIAILDTGIDVNHPDLADKIVSSVNFTDSSTAYANGQSHGTHVAGIAAAITNNGVGIAGLGRNSSLMNVKVLGDTGYGYYSWIAQGIIWAADHGANVINLSLGGSTASPTLENAVNYAWSKGVVVVAAAGNNGSTSPFYPADYTNCISVAATDSNDALASWSNHGSWVNVAAPGASIYSCIPGNQYGYMSGTSMASPHVAGLCGLVFSVANDTNGNGKLNDEVRSAVEASCDRVGIDVAYGRINAYRAVQLDSSPSTPTPTPTPTPMPTPTPTPTPTPVPTITVNMDAPDFAAEDSVFIARVNVTGVTGFYSANYDIVFNPSVFEVDNVTNGQIDSTLIPVDTWEVITPGVIRVVQNVEELHGVSSSGYIAELHFHVIGSDSSSSEIDFSNGVFNDINANQMPATWTGKTGIGVYKLGDANDDGRVNSLDIAKLERIIIGLDDRTPGADASGDGNVNALDIAKVELVMMGR